MASKATPNLSPGDAIILARYLARKAIRARWQAQGLKPQYIEPSELAKAAEAYLSEHRAELIEEAWARLSVRIPEKVRTLRVRRTPITQGETSHDRHKLDYSKPNTSDPEAQLSLSSAGVSDREGS